MLIERATAVESYSLQLRGSKDGVVSRMAAEKTIQRHDAYIRQKETLDGIFTKHDKDFVRLALPSPALPPPLPAPAASAAAAAPAAHVINTSSICGFYAQIGYLKPNVSYSAAKFAVRGFTLGLLADFKLNAPHIKASCVMPGWIGTGLIDSSQQIFDNSMKAIIAGRRSASVRLRARIAELKLSRDPTTLVLQNENLLEILGDVDLTQFKDKELMQMLTFLGPGFRSNAPTSAKKAAEIILRGVAADEWNILVGEDAHSLAKLMREDEVGLYDDGTIVPDFFNYETWKMNRERGKVGSGGEKIKSKM